jgi:3-oxoacyl-[acyl-carrier-protein] synthase III
MLELCTETVNRSEISRDDVFEGRCAIAALGYWVPDDVVSTAEGERSAGRKLDVERRTGVREYRRTQPGMSVCDMAMLAIGNMCEGMSETGTREDAIDGIDTIIYCSVSREYLEPATAALIQDRLGIECANAFDISNACLGVLDGMCVANAMIAASQAGKVLLVSAEIGSLYNHLGQKALRRGEKIKANLASLTLGDGAVAMLITAPGTAEGELVVRRGTRRTYGRESDHCKIWDKQTPMYSDPGRLFAAALERFPPLFFEVTEATGWSPDDIDVVVPHQASLPATRMGAESIGVPMERFAITLNEYGNMASVSLPLTLARVVEGRSRPAPRRIVLLGFGSGLGICVLTLERRAPAWSAPSSW